VLVLLHQEGAIVFNPLMPAGCEAVSVPGGFCVASDLVFNPLRHPSAGHRAGKGVPASEHVHDAARQRQPAASSIRARASGDELDGYEPSLTTDEEYHTDYGRGTSDEDAFGHSALTARSEVGGGGLDPVQQPAVQGVAACGGDASASASELGKSKGPSKKKLVKKKSKKGVMLGPPAGRGESAPRRRRASGTGSKSGRARSRSRDGRRARSKPSIGGIELPAWCGSALDAVKWSPPGVIIGGRLRRGAWWALLFVLLEPKPK